MTNWILFVVMSAAGGTGFNMYQQPAITSAQFADRGACEAAAQTVRSMAEKQAALKFVTVATSCVPAATTP